MIWWWCHLLHRMKGCLRCAAYILIPISQSKLPKARSFIQLGIRETSASCSVSFHIQEGVCFPTTSRGPFEFTVALGELWEGTSKFKMTTQSSIGSLSQEQEEIEPALKIHFVSKEMVFIKLKKCLKAIVLYFLSYCCYWHKMNSFYNSSLALVGDRMVIRKKL